MFGAALLGTGAAAVSSLQPTHAEIGVPTTAPSATIKVEPDVGTRGPVVRIERVRRSGANGPTDTGILPFEAIVKNTGTAPIELHSLKASYSGQSVPTSSATFDGWASAKLMYNLGFGATGTVVDDKSATDWVSAHSVVVFDSKYTVSGTALDGATPRLYIGHHRTDGVLSSEATLAAGDRSSGFASMNVGTEGDYAAGVLVGGSLGVGSASYGLLARYGLNAGNIALDTKYGTNGIATIDVAGCTNDAITTMRVATGTPLPWTVVAGRTNCQGVNRAFVARLDVHGNLDKTFGWNGIAMLPGANTEAVDLGIQSETVDGVAERQIYVLAKSGTACDDTAADCAASVRKLRWSGAPATSYGDAGTATLELASTKAVVPAGMRFAPSGLVVVGTRLASGSNARGVVVAKLDTDGELDGSYGDGGSRFLQFAGQPTLARAMTHIPSAPGTFAIASLALVPGNLQVVMYRIDGIGDVISTASNRQPAGELPRPMAIVAVSNILVAGSENGRTLLTRYRSDGRIDWRGILDPNEEQRIQFPDARELASFPTSLRFDLFFNGFTSPISISPKVVEDARVMPFPGEATTANYAWSPGHHHRVGDLHRGNTDQRHAYDIGLSRWDAASNKWTAKRANTAGLSPNEKYEVWGREVRAAFAGRIVQCWRAAIDNSNPPFTTEYQQNPMPGGGNMFRIEAPDGSYKALYAHFQAGSVSASVCPNTCTKYDATIPWTHPGQETCGADIEPAYYVTKGQLLGRVGNSGSSGGPHFHFHIQDAQGGAPVYFENTLTDQRVPVAQQHGKVALAGEAAPAPPLSEEVTSLLWPLTLVLDIKL
jgi:hypothetical protein